MEQYEESNFNESGYGETGRGWMRPALIALLVVAVLATAYGLRERSEVRQLQAQAVVTNTSMGQLQSQVNDLQTKLSNMVAAQPPPAPVATAPAAPSSSETASIAEEKAEPPANVVAPVAVPPKSSAPKHLNTKRKVTATDKRYTQLKSQLDEQQKQLKDAQDQIAKNRSDLEGSISSTRDELNGSIAKTHEELVVLEKRGERSYFEFDLTKSKQFQRFGPITLSLRKADSKHKNYDLAMIVDDNELNKKKVNLYEPIWIHTENGGQQVQVVVNRIEKDIVHGYVSAPRYKASELATLSSTAGASPAGSQAQTATQPQ